MIVVECPCCGTTISARTNWDCEEKCKTEECVQCHKCKLHCKCAEGFLEYRNYSTRAANAAIGEYRVRLAQAIHENNKKDSEIAALQTKLNGTVSQIFNDLGIIKASKDGVLHKHGWEGLPWQDWFLDPVETLRVFGSLVEHPETLKKLPKGAKLGEKGGLLMPVYIPSCVMDVLLQVEESDGVSPAETVVTLIEDNFDIEYIDSIEV